MKKEKVETPKNVVPKKLDKDWIAYVIDITAGQQLLMISMRYPDKAEKLVSILKRAVEDIHKKKGKELKNKPEDFTKFVTTTVWQLMENFCMTNLTHTLTDGMPARQQILMPGVVANPPGPVRKG